MVRLDLLDALVVAEEVLALDRHDEAPQSLQRVQVVPVLAVDEILETQTLLLQLVEALHHRLRLLLLLVAVYLRLLLLQFLFHIEISNIVNK